MSWLKWLSIFHNFGRFATIFATLSLMSAVSQELFEVELNNRSTLFVSGLTRADQDLPCF